jgi:hypothetical protein
MQSLHLKTDNHNMKKYFFCCLILFLSISSFAQKGWRENEMEVKVFLSRINDAASLYDLQLNGDIYPLAGYALIYVIPSELEKIKKAQLKYEISKNDLNEYYKDFWSQKAGQYHTYDQIISLMDSLETAFPSICKKTVLGSSVEGREISYLKISDNVAIDESEAEVAFDGGIHGDEIGGPENLIRFARYICSNYGQDAEITDMIDNREIYIYTMVNPDGRVNMSRYNGNGVDCNRDFGYMWNGEGYSTAAYSQVETRFMRDFMYDKHFSTHVTYHSGTEEVIFPWCYRSDHAPDYNCFYNQAALYSSSSGYSYLPYLQSYDDYPTNGELIDGSFGVNGPVSLTMEISTDKQTSDIQGYYQKNIDPMIAMIKNSGYGLEGIITDSITGNPIAAAIFVNNLFPVFSDSLIGDYHKFVLPGTYSIKVVANNYETRTITGVIVSSASSAVTNIKMKAANGSYISKVAAVVIPDNNTADEANTPAVIGAPDDIYYSIGKNGWIIADMLQPVKNISGNDFKVYEGDATAESYSCYASQSMDGPWTFLGTGTGTQEFDLSALSQARFIKITDDGDGTATAIDAGFDLDAIEALEQTVDIFSVNNDNDLTIRIFPNPAENEIYFSTNLTEYNAAIYNSQGAIVYKGQDPEVLNVSSFPSGLYFVNVIDLKNNHHYEATFIKE